MGQEMVGREESIYDLDPTKLLIHVRQLGITGHDAEKWLREKWKIEVELSDLYNILCLITPGDDEESVSPSGRGPADVGQRNALPPYTANAIAGYVA